MKFSQVFRSFRTCSDLFRRVWMHSDAYGCIRLRPDAFGCIGMHWGAFGNFECLRNQLFAIFAKLQCFGRLKRQTNFSSRINVYSGYTYPELCATRDHEQRSFILNFMHRRHGLHQTWFGLGQGTLAKEGMVGAISWAFEC